jgi:hypothetical protein
VIVLFAGALGLAAGAFHAYRLRRGAAPSLRRLVVVVVVIVPLVLFMGWGLAVNAAWLVFVVAWLGVVVVSEAWRLLEARVDPA